MRRLAAVWVTGALVIGCATTTPYVGQGPHRQLTRGAAVPLVDFLGNVLALPTKLILWNRRFSNHTISEPTEARLVQYLDSRSLPAFEDTTYRLNQYAPFGDLGALMRNQHVAWPYRLLLGLPVTVIIDVLLPARLFPWGDYFNPYTNIAHLYSDEPAVVLHEAGHAYDFAQKRYKGTYAAARIIPFVDLYQEWRATDEAVDYLIELDDRRTEFRAYKTLWPAFGVYAGGYVLPPFGNAAGVVVGHAVGRFKAHRRQRYYDELDAALQATTISPPPAPELSPVPALEPVDAQPPAGN